MVSGTAWEPHKGEGEKYEPSVQVKTWKKPQARTCDSESLRESAMIKSHENEKLWSFRLVPKKSQGGGSVLRHLGARGMGGHTADRNRRDMQSENKERDYKNFVEKRHVLSDEACVNGDSNPDLEHGKLEFYP